MAASASVVATQQDAAPAAAMVTAPFDDLDRIFEVISSLAPKLQGVGKALRRQRAALELRIQQLEGAGSAKDARIAQLEECLLQGSNPA